MKVLSPLLASALLLGCRADSARVHVSESTPPANPLAGWLDDDDDDDEHEVVVAADAIPALVRAAALAAVPGLEIQEAELEASSTGGQQYCVHGTVDGELVEVEVDADGTVQEIERGDDEDEDDE